MRTLAAKVTATVALAAALFLGTETLAQAAPADAPTQITVATDSNPWD